MDLITSERNLKKFYIPPFNQNLGVVFREEKIKKKTARSIKPGVKKKKTVRRATRSSHSFQVVYSRAEPSDKR